MLPVWASSWVRFCARSISASCVCRSPARATQACCQRNRGERDSGSSERTVLLAQLRLRDLLVAEQLLQLGDVRAVPHDLRTVEHKEYEPNNQHRGSLLAASQKMRSSAHRTHTAHTSSSRCACTAARCKMPESVDASPPSPAPADWPPAPPAPAPAPAPTPLLSPVIHAISRNTLADEHTWPQNEHGQASSKGDRTRRVRAIQQRSGQRASARRRRAARRRSQSTRHAA